MNEKPDSVSSIEEYILLFSPGLQIMLQKMRFLIRKCAPEATEKISYQMPTFYLNGNLVHFALHAHHIGFYPAPSAISFFQKELIPYKTSKGAIQFPLEQEMPWNLIEKIVRFRREENLTKQSKKK